MARRLSGLNGFPAQAHDRKTSVSSALWLVVSLGAAGWIVWSSRGDVALLADTSIWIIAAMTAMHTVSIITQSERFRIVLQQHAGGVIRIGSWSRLYVRGRLFSSLVPQSGHLYRGLALKQDHGTPAMRYVSSLATQTWLAVMAGLGFAALILLLSPFGEEEIDASTAIQGLVGTMLALGAAPIVVTRFSRRMPERVATPASPASPVKPSALQDRLPGAPESSSSF